MYRLKTSIQPNPTGIAPCPMPYDPGKHHRRSIRLPTWDYRWPGAYFVTACTHQRVPLFGRVVDGRMRLSAFGRVVAEEWHRTPTIRPELAMDAFIVMPDHIHGIVAITESSVGAQGAAPLRHRKTADGRPKRQPRSLGAFISGFKSAVTKRINRTRGTPGSPVWQRNYWERIIRDMDEMNAIRQYITDNPTRWHHNRSHPAGPRM